MTTLTVLIHPAVETLLDSLLSPIDGIVATDTVHSRLAAAHRPRRSFCRSRSTPLYRGGFDVLPVEFVYVQVGEGLHVIDARDIYAHESPRFDCVLSTEGIGPAFGGDASTDD